MSLPKSCSLREACWQGHGARDRYSNGGQLHNLSVQGMPRNSLPHLPIPDPTLVSRNLSNTAVVPRMSDGTASMNLDAGQNRSRGDLTAKVAELMRSEWSLSPVTNHGSSFPIGDMLSAR